MTTQTPDTPTITFARGDGIGPEIMEAVLKMLEASGAQLDLQEIEIGEKVYLKGISAGISPQAWETLRRNKIFLKAPITTPQGGGYKSLNVTVRKSLGLYANVRPCVTYAPFVRTRHPGMDVVIVRENEEDTYGGIEHRQTPEVYQCLKLITRPGCEKIVRYAFEYARQHGRKKVSCFTKDNIMKFTDGLFHKVFDEIGAEYPEIEQEHRIIDIGTALLADDPTWFDVIVLPNLYGDIVSDVAAQSAGSVGMAGSANIGDSHAMFEAIHGSAPPMAGQNIANPSALLHGALLMLHHVGQGESAVRLHNAWLSTLESGFLTRDMRHEGRKCTVVGTQEFAQAVIDHLGQEPRTLKRVQVAEEENAQIHGRAWRPAPRPKKELVGVDVFLDWDEPGRDPNALGQRLEAAVGDGLRLSMITNRGTKVYPGGIEETFCTDHWRCRFRPSQEGTEEGATVSPTAVLDLLQRLHEAGLDFIKTEHLYTFDGVRGYSLGQGE